MKRIFVLMLVFAACHVGEAHGQGVHYTLRTVPPTPVAGEPFLAVFNDLQCEEFILIPPAAPPVVTVEGNVVTVAADRVEVVDCSSPSATYSIPVKGLPAGDYTLRLLARYLDEPGNETVEESAPFTVGYGTVVVPATGALLLTALVTAICLAGLNRQR